MHATQRARSIVALLLTLPLLAASAAAQSEVWTVDRDTNLIRRVFVPTGATISQKGMLLPGFNISGAEGLARRPQDGQLFVLLNLNSPARMLARVDPETGACTAVGNSTDTFVSLAFQPGFLFAVTSDGAAQPETLCLLGQGDAAPTFFTLLGNGDAGEAIAWHAPDALMFHGSGLNTRVFEKINLVTQAVTNIPLSGANYGQMLALAHTTGNEFLLSNANDQLYRITTAGVCTFVANLNHTASGIVPIEDVGTPSCFGDGSIVACPCGNQSPAGGGCANSTSNGARLGARGTPSVSSDSIELEALFVPDQPGIFFQGQNFILSPPPFGDGLRCCGQNIVRWITILAAGGCASSKQPSGCGTHIGGPGGSIAALAGLSAGDTRCYQYWYRDPVNSPCANGFNLSNAYALQWQP